MSPCVLVQSPLHPSSDVSFKECSMHDKESSLNSALFPLAMTSSATTSAVEAAGHRQKLSKSAVVTSSSPPSLSADHIFSNELLWNEKKNQKSYMGFGNETDRDRMRSHTLLSAIPSHLASTASPSVASVSNLTLDTDTNSSFGSILKTPSGSNSSIASANHDSMHPIRIPRTSSHQRATASFFVIPSRYQISDSVIEGLQILSLCLLWYSFSAMTSNLGKAILTEYKRPVSLSYTQFAFVFTLCFILSGRLKYRIVQPTRQIVMKVSPIALFLIGGHVLSSIAISNASVALVHTIKALSPLVTVFCSAYFLQVNYDFQVYISLIPLTLGVVLICVKNFSFFTMNVAFGAFVAFLSTIIFVLQTLVTKNLLNSESSITGHLHHLDKVNMLFYSALLSFMLMTPLWLYYEGYSILFKGDLPTWHTTQLVLFNGVSHFLQNIFSFWMLSLVSPVAYSIASLAKRIFVILAAFIYFREPLTFGQGVGIILTSYGLWMYNHSKQTMANRRRGSKASPRLLPR